MKKVIRSIILLFCLIVVSFSLQAKKTLNVVVTNSWTAAYAEAAGVKNVIQLAPSNMVHPPEYELKPSDVLKIKNADLLIYAGYEVLMKTVFKNFNKPKDSMLKIKTGYSPVIMKESIMQIAKRTGTTDSAKKSVEEIDSFFKDARVKLKKLNLYGKPVLVHFHQVPFMKALGFEIAGVFGPGPLKAGDLRSLSKKNAVLIIDNAHNPVAGPLKEITGLKTLEFINFPGFVFNGKSAPTTLVGVMKDNFSKF